MYPHIHITIPSYALMAAIGGFVAVIFVYLRIEKIKLPFIDFLKMLAVCVVCGFLGSRIVFVLSRIPWLIGNFSLRNAIATIIGGGLVFYGGLLGVLFGVHHYCKKHGIAKRPVFNMIAPAIPLFHAFGRIGCFLSGCCYGIELIPPVTIFNITFYRLPTQLIEVLFELLLFITILVLQARFNPPDSLKIYMLTYSIFRFVIEFFRGDTIRGVFFGISTSQMISMGILAFYIVQSIRKQKSKHENPTQDET